MGAPRTQNGFINVTRRRAFFSIFSIFAVGFFLIDLSAGLSSAEPVEQGQKQKLDHSGETERLLFGGWLGTLSAAAATFGTIIAAGQAFSEFIRGFNQRKIKEIEAQSIMAESYLKLVIDKDVSANDKSMLLQALSKLQGHPLQGWARQLVGDRRAESDAIFRDRQRRYNLLQQEKDPGKLEVLVQENEIQEIIDEMKHNIDDFDACASLHLRLTSKLEIFAKLKAAKSLSESVKEALVYDANPMGNAADSLAASITLSNRLTVQKISDACPNVPPENIAIILPFLIAAMQEFKFFDPKTIAFTIATIATQTANFRPVAEFAGRPNSLKQPFDKYDAETSLGGRLGNIDAGDAAAFRGRGFVQITGRAAYTRVSSSLGLGTLLVDHPDLANDPAIGARILCYMIAERIAEIKPALDANDLSKAVQTLFSLMDSRKFVTCYEHILSDL